jgi:hypothetical protein
MKAYSGRGGIATLTVNPSYFDPSNHEIGGWVGSTAGLHALKKKEITCPRRESNRECSVIQPILSELLWLVICDTDSEFYEHLETHLHRHN